LAGFTPRIVQQFDSLDLVEDLNLDGHSIRLLPINRPLRDGLGILRLSDASVILTAYAVIRLGRSNWPPLRMILDRLRAQSLSLPQENWHLPAGRTLLAGMSTYRADNTQPFEYRIWHQMNQCDTSPAALSVAQGAKIVFCLAF
jgi:hypothetical protein